MKTLTKFVSAAAVAISLIAVAAPSQASTVIGFSSSTTNPNFTWTRNGVTGAGAGGTLVGTGVGTFSFLEAPLFPDLFTVPVTFSYSATSTFGPATQDPETSLWAQQGLAGSFSYIYTGIPTLTFGSYSVATGANLLSGTFSNSWIQGGGHSGSTNVAVATGGVAHFTSDFDSFGSNAEFAYNLLGVTPSFGAAANRGLTSFTAYGNGTFSVPEPSTWALMIMGFGGVGAMIRRRRQGVAFA